MSRAAIAAVLCALACAGALLAPAAHADDASSDHARALARAAADGDAAALERLRAVDRVDGRPVRVERLLQGSPDDVRERLRVLAAEPAARPPGSAARGRDAGAVARDVLADRRYHPSEFPRPLRGVVEDVGRAIASPFRAAFRWLEDHLGSFAAWTLVAGVLLAVTAVLAVRAGARRQRGSAEQASAARGGERASAAQLRAAADRAEAGGELSEALRLRFRAGLLDLDSRELIALRPALTNHELLRAVRSPTLGGLVDGFEAVAYGGRAAVADDVRRAREGWPRVLEEARAR